MTEKKAEISTSLSVLFSLLFWGITIYDIIFYIIRKKEFSIPTNFIFYFASILTQFCSRRFRIFLFSKNIRNVLKANIEKKFSINYYGKAYHQESGENGDFDYTTYKETYPYFFKSGADCSVIDIDSKDMGRLRYIDLEIEQIWICADEETYQEEKEACNNFSNEISKKDKQFKVERKIIIPGTTDRVSIYITNFCLTFLDKFLYIIFMLLSFGIIYKCFISCYIAKTKITIIKVISNHYDLTQTDAFFNIQPVVKLFREDIQFDRKKYAFSIGKGLELMISEKNPLRKQLKSIIDNAKVKKIINNTNSFQLLDTIDDDEADNKNENGGVNTNKDNNNKNNNKNGGANPLETPFIA